ncbi:MAG: hypothetical protein IKW58_00515 [Alphaproteobacteria bacterium]|nr:hypothetical protein [Alphaproteobacteria bacterium]
MDFFSQKDKRELKTKHVKDIVKRELNKIRISFSEKFLNANYRDNITEESVKSLHEELKNIFISNDQEDLYNAHIENFEHFKQNGDIQKPINLETEESQLFWGIALGYYASHPEIASKWQNLNEGNCRLSETTLWKRIEKSSYMQKELTKHAYVVNDTLEDKNTKIIWHEHGYPNISYCFIPTEKVIVDDMLWTLVCGTDAASTAINHEIAHSKGTQFTQSPKMEQLSKEQEGFVEELSRLSSANDKDEWIKVAKKAARNQIEYEYRFRFLDELENMFANRYSVEFGGEYDKAHLNELETVINVGIKYLSPKEKEALKKEIETSAERRIQHVKDIARNSFFANNELVSNIKTDDWQSIHLFPDLLTGIDKDGRKMGSKESFEKIREICDQFEQKCPSFYLKLNDKELYDARMTALSKQRVKLVDEFFDMFVAHHMEEIYRNSDKNIENTIQQLEQQGKISQQQQGNSGKIPPMPPQSSQCNKGNCSQGSTPSPTPQQGSGQSGQPQPQQSSGQGGQPIHQQNSQVNPNKQNGQGDKQNQQQNDGQGGSKDQTNGGNKEKQDQNGQGDKQNQQQNDGQGGSKDQTDGGNKENQDQNGQGDKENQQQNDGQGGSKDQTNGGNKEKQDQNGQGDKQNQQQNTQGGGNKDQTDGGNKENQDQNGQGGSKDKDDQNGQGGSKDKNQQQKDSGDKGNNSSEPKLDENGYPDSKNFEIEQKNVNKGEELSQDEKNEIAKKAEKNGSTVEDLAKEAGENIPKEQLPQRSSPLERIKSSAKENSNGDIDNDKDDLSKYIPEQDVPILITPEKMKRYLQSDNAGYDILQGSYDEYQKRVAKYKDEIARIRVLIKKIITQKKLDSIKHGRAQIKKEQTLLPYNGAQTLDVSRQRKLIQKIRSNDPTISEDDFRRFSSKRKFREDEIIEKTEIEESNFAFIIDGSGSMAGGPFKSAMATAHVLYEATKSFKEVNIFIYVMGQPTPTTIAKPGMSTKEIGERLDAAEKEFGYGCNDHIVPAMQQSLADIAENMGKNANSTSGFIHIFPITDGGNNDYAGLTSNLNGAYPNKCIKTLIENNEYLTFDWLFIDQQYTNYTKPFIEDMKKKGCTQLDYVDGVFSKYKGDVVKEKIADKVIELLARRIRHSQVKEKTQNGVKKKLIEKGLQEIKRYR